MTFFDIFFIGVGLAMDASCVSASNGLTYKPSVWVSIRIAVIYAIFQAIMPLLGYFGVGLFSLKILEYNQVLALVLLSILGGKMVYDSLTEGQEEIKYQDGSKILTIGILLIQGITTSIDALSVGITFNNYNLEFVLYAVMLIAIITMVMCFISVRIGIEIGTRLNHKAELVGGLVLIILGIKIYIMG